MKPIIYTAPDCPFCKQTKEFFKKNKISYTEKDVSKNSKYADEMIEKSGQTGTPVIIIGKEIIAGFNEEKLTKALKK